MSVIARVVFDYELRTGYYVKAAQDTIRIASSPFTFSNATAANGDAAPLPITNQEHLLLLDVDHLDETAADVFFATVGGFQVTGTMKFGASSGRGGIGFPKVFPKGQQVQVNSTNTAMDIMVVYCMTDRVPRQC